MRKGFEVKWDDGPHVSGGFANKHRVHVTGPHGRRMRLSASEALALRDLLSKFLAERLDLKFPRS